VQDQPFGGRQQRGFLQSLQTLLVRDGVLHHVAHPVLDGLVVVLHEQVFGHAPDLREPAVEGAHAAAEIGDEDAVGGGFERGLQHGRQVFLFGLRKASRAGVEKRHQAVRRRGGTGHRERLDAASQVQEGAIRALHDGVGQQRLDDACLGIRPVGHVLGRAEKVVRARGAQTGFVHSEPEHGRRVGRHDLQRRKRHHPGRVRAGLHQHLPGGDGRVGAARGHPKRAHGVHAGSPTVESDSKK